MLNQYSIHHRYVLGEMRPRFFIMVLILANITTDTIYSLLPANAGGHCKTRRQRVFKKQNTKLRSFCGVLGICYTCSSNDQSTCVLGSFAVTATSWLAVVTCQCPGCASYALHTARPFVALFLSLLYCITLNTACTIAQIEIISLT
jgi:hypothetical protein